MKVVKQNIEYEKLDKKNEGNQFDRQNLDYYLKKIGALNRPANEALKYLKRIQYQDTTYLKSPKFQNELLKWKNEMKKIDQSGDFSGRTNDFNYMKGGVNNHKLVKLEQDITDYVVLKTEEIKEEIDNLNARKKSRILIQIIIIN